MVEAYVLIKVESGKEYDVARKVEGIEGVKEVLITYGMYDMIVKVEAGTINKLKEIVLSIRKIDGVVETVTLIGVGEGV